ncbi:hypothetical protein NW761_008374 [Fusarium oxysporum]|nr:hypothetical protein NW758_006627 [Fusarium oxysporum]KAJ4086753.1 hypothetical protein NW761_008374 [Fusarium oxysporum]
MVVVAVAGGTGGIGGAIVDTLRPNPHHKMIILTRKARVPENSTCALCMSLSLFIQKASSVGSL